MDMDKKTIPIEEYRMIDTLSQLYLFCYLIDLDGMRYQRMDDVSERRQRRVGDSGHYEDEREWFLTQIVDQAHQARMRRFTQVSTLEERLKGKLWVYEDYQNPAGKRVRAAYLPATYDEADGHLTHVLFVGQELEQTGPGDEDEGQTLEREQLSRENVQLQKDNEQIQEQLETVMRGIRGGYMICEDTDDFPFRYVSPAAAHVQGYDTVEEFLEANENSALKNIWPADRESFLEKYHSQLADKDTYSVKYRVVCKDGSPKWVMDSGKQMVDENGCHLIGFLLLDIDRHERINQMYKLERSQYRDALLSDCEYAFTIDLSENLILSGYLKDEKKAADAVRDCRYPIPVNDTLRKIWSGFQAAGTEATVDSLLSTHTVKQAYESGARNCELEYYDARRQQYLRVTILMSEREENSHIIAIVFGRDITKQKQEQEQGRRMLEETNEKLRAACEEAEAANAAKTDFLARMSHDIRTPLNGILGLLEIAGRCADDPKKVEDCRQKAVASATHLLSLLNDVLDMSKMESGRLELAEEPFDMNELLHQTYEIMESQLAGMNILGITTNQEPLRHPHVIGSPLHVRQILTNLISNAVKYNHVGGTIRAGMEELNVDEQTVVFRFTISDTGIGMSEEFQKHIFEPFAREKDNGAEQTSGTGLGMAIVKRIIDKMGGTIEVHSRINEGSTFIVTLPFRRDLAQTPAGEPQPEESYDLNGVRILLVEDNDLNREIAQYLLSDEGAEVEVAVNGREALQIYEASEPDYYDVILMDMMMPVLDGCSTVRILRRMVRPDAHTIPIIALTANAFSDDVRRCREAGMDAHLAKPLDIRTAVRLIRRFV